MKNVKYISSLTPLRGIAAVWLLFHHFDLFLSVHQFSKFSTHTTLLTKGYLWVDFFFILSGFVICHVYGEALINKSKKNILKYVWARFSRLYPLHLFIMILSLVRILILNVSVPEYAENQQNPFFSAYDFFVHLFFLQPTGLLENIYSWNVPSWSIAAEWWVYLIAILLFPLLNKGWNRITPLIWLICVAGLVAITFDDQQYRLDANTSILGIARCLLEFTIGIGVYQWYKFLQKRQTFWNTDWLIGLIFIGILLILHLGLYDVLVIPFFMLLVLCAALNSGKAKDFLNSKPIYFLGKISFSIYLIQMFWIELWMLWLDFYYHPYVENEPSIWLKLLWLFIIFALTVVSSYFTYRYVEIPSRDKLRKIFAK